MISLGPFLASYVSCIKSFLFLLALVLRFFFTNLSSSAYSPLSFNVLFTFCHNSFFFLSKVSVSVSSALFLIVEYWGISFCVVSIGSFRILFIFSIVAYSSFKASNLFLNSNLKEVTDLSKNLRSNLSGFCFWIFFSLNNFLFISALALTPLWSLPIFTWL